MTKLVFGCGYLGLRVALGWRERGHRVFAVTRSAERAKKFASLGLTPVIADVTNPASLRALPTAETVLYAVGYDRSGGQTIAQVYVEGLANVLAALANDAERIVYISSTGVYGQSHGEWVDENSPCLPVREGGEACLAAERQLQNHPLGRRVAILRLGGIYGPGRIPRRSELEAGRPILAPAEGFLNLIHVDDAAKIVRLADARAGLPCLYNVTDGQPVLRKDYFDELTRLAGAPAPRFEKPPPSDPRAERAVSDKRVSNDKLLAELQPAFAFPSYRDGLATILAQE
jgi:nucleoside-diphosphate-sugar epimerase